MEEAIEYCGHAWSDKGALRIKETFWGSLGDPSSIMNLIQEASSSEGRPPGSGGSRNHGIKFLCITKPPETVLMLVAPSLDLYSVLDTHTRTLGTSQYPATIYRCRNLEVKHAFICALAHVPPPKDLALLLSTNFFPLPPGQAQCFHPPSSFCFRWQGSTSRSSGRTPCSSSSYSSSPPPLPPQRIFPQALLTQKSWRTRKMQQRRTGGLWRLQGVPREGGRTVHQVRRSLGGGKRVQGSRRRRGGREKIG